VRGGSPSRHNPRIIIAGGLRAYPRTERSIRRPSGCCTRLRMRWSGASISWFDTWPTCRECTGGGGGVVGGGVAGPVPIRGPSPCPRRDDHTPQEPPGPRGGGHWLLEPPTARDSQEINSAVSWSAGGPLMPYHCAFFCGEGGLAFRRPWAARSSGIIAPRKSAKECRVALGEVPETRTAMISSPPAATIPTSARRPAA